tara:strand:+ start:63 stop:185 length:123 start_codon:yes stop_codon:yes gene_type:complete
MLGDTMNLILEAIMGMAISFGFIGLCVWATLKIEQWRETR